MYKNITKTTLHNRQVRQSMSIKTLHKRCTNSAKKHWTIMVYTSHKHMYINDKHCTKTLHARHAQHPMSINNILEAAAFSACWFPQPHPIWLSPLQKHLFMARHTLDKVNNARQGLKWEQLICRVVLLWWSREASRCNLDFETAKSVAQCAEFWCFHFHFRFLFFRFGTENPILFLHVSF